MRVDENYMFADNVIINEQIGVDPARISGLDGRPYKWLILELARAKRTEDQAHTPKAELKTFLYLHMPGVDSFEVGPLENESAGLTEYTRIKRALKNGQLEIVSDRLNLVSADGRHSGEGEVSVDEVNIRDVRVV